MPLQIPMSLRDVSGNQSALLDQNLLIPMGVYPGISAVNVFGRNRNAADGVEEEIYSVENAATFPATALMTSISQTTDAVDVQGEDVIIVGLDATWAEVTQTAIINASNSTTVVTLSTALIRVNSMKMAADTVIATPVRLHNAGETTDYAVILAGEERATQAHYTVPLGFTAYMTRFWAIRNDSVSASDTDTVDIQLYETDQAGPFMQTLVDSFMIDPFMSGSSVERNYGPYRKFGPQTDIIATVQATSTVADVSAGFDLILVEDASYG